MNDPVIKYVSKSVLYPAFGEARRYKNHGIILVRDDLPRLVKDFIIQHEKYHISDTSTNWVWREIKANVSGARTHIIGFVYCLILSLSPSRLMFYANRFRRGK